jgi:anaerobic ribonucleoside-triphosphate reductase activating protein
MSRLMINRAHHPVTTLGPGVRAGIWTQGCTIGCPNCASQDTWQPRDEGLIEVGRLVDWLATLSPLDGLTVTGGEPFQQVEPLTALLEAVRTWVGSTGRTLDVLVYSGYSYSALRRRPAAREALAWCDAVITGPYVDRRNPGGRWRGSANQQLHVLSDLGRARFGPDGDQEAAPDLQSRLQTSSDGERIWLIGIPARGDLQRLETSLRERGVDLEGTSWTG